MNASCSPAKPRLLWRGALHLADGTALPGIAIVSTVQPAFPSARAKEEVEQSKIKDKDDEQGHTGAATSSKSPLTLDGEAQDELCLSIEMVRHAPLQVTGIVNGVKQSANGGLYLPESQVSGGTAKEREKAGQSNPSQANVAFEAGGHVRLYIDPTHQSTLAFFERLFCYEEDDVHGTKASAESADQSSVCASTVLVFSLDKTIVKIVDTKTSLEDVASDPLWRGGPVSSAKYNHASATLGFGMSASMEAVVIAVKRVDSTGTHMELHVGRKMIKRQMASLDTSDPSSAPLPHSVSGNPSLPARPDDPAPRSLSRVFARTLSRGSIVQKATAPRTLHAKKQSHDFAVPEAPLRDGKQKESLKREGKKSASEQSNVESKRRGTRTVLQRSHSTAIDGDASQLAPSDAFVDSQESASMCASSVDATDTSAAPSIEERNRSMVKKLVHYQLLGKGIERSDDAYHACFGTTCQGALVALRHIAKTQRIDRQQAVSVIERHLDMYL